MNGSGNPALSEQRMERFESKSNTTIMTMGGVLTKIGLTFAVLIIAATFGWLMAPQLITEFSTRLLWVGMIALLVVGFWAAFKPGLLSVLFYAAIEGVYLGVMSRAFDSIWGGIVTQAVLITISIAIGAYFLYAAGLVRVTEKFRSVVSIATFGVLIFIAVEWILSMFLPNFVGITFSGVWGVLIGLVIVIVAALNLFSDYAVIDEGIKEGLSKKAEWYVSFGLTVTLIWLYVSVLRLLASSQNDN